MPYDPKPFGSRFPNVGHNVSRPGHQTLHGTDDHISWDVDEEGNYVPGSGHRVDHRTGKIEKWDKPENSR